MESIYSRAEALNSNPRKHSVQNIAGTALIKRGELASWFDSVVLLLHSLFITVETGQIIESDILNRVSRATSVLQKPKGGIYNVVSR